MSEWLLTKDRTLLVSVAKPPVGARKMGFMFVCLILFGINLSDTTLRRFPILINPCLMTVRNRCRYPYSGSMESFARRKNLTSAFAF